jgi:hypothetical protein
MATEQYSDVALAGGARVTGLPASTAAGHAVNHQQLVAAGLFAAALNVASASFGYAEVVVPFAGVTPASRVVAAWAATLDEENDLEEIADSQLQVTGVPETDQIRFVLISGNASPFVGVFNIDYRVSL